MASNDLGGQIEYAYDTPGWISGGVFEIIFFNISSGFCVKSEHTNGQTDSFQLYIYRLSISDHFDNFYFLPLCSKLQNLLSLREGRIFEIIQKFFCGAFSIAKRLTVCVSQLASSKFSKIDPPYCAFTLGVPRNRGPSWNIFWNFFPFSKALRPIDFENSFFSVIWKLQST